MNRFRSTEPDSDPALQRLIVQSRAQLRDTLMRREALLDWFEALAVVAVAVAMTLEFGVAEGLDPLVAAGLVAAFALASRVEFRVGAGVAVPTQLVFVPMLFIAGPGLAPVLVIAAGLVSRIPEYTSGKVHVSRALVRTAEAWYAVPPALLLAAAGATAPDWADWPLYAAALVAQFGFDFGLSWLRETGRLKITAGELWREFRAVYVVDLALSPVGLLTAFAAVDAEWVFLLVLPLVALIHLFSREREARIDNALTLSAAYRGTAHLLGELLSTTHEYTGHHSRSVVVLAHQVGEELGLDERTLREIEFGALLHDVGKMAVPNEIINKPGRLTEEEWEVMKTHTVEGYEMLEKIGGVLAEAGAVVRSHHERFDGAGYPDGLAGEQIPIAARVVTACDSFNAMTTDRPYRAAMSVAEAIEELRAHAGTQFDPRVVEGVVRVVETWADPPADPASDTAAARPGALAAS